MFCFPLKILILFLVFYLNVDPTFLSGTHILKSNTNTHLLLCAKIMADITMEPKAINNYDMFKVPLRQWKTLYHSFMLDIFYLPLRFSAYLYFTHRIEL